MNRNENEYFKKYEIFNDQDYILTLTTIDTTNSHKNDNPTVILNLLKKNVNQIDTLINDSLFSRNPIGVIPEIKVEFIDFIRTVQKILLFLTEQIPEEIAVFIYI